MARKKKVVVEETPTVEIEESEKFTHEKLDVVALVLEEEKTQVEVPPEEEVTQEHKEVQEEKPEVIKLANPKDVRFFYRDDCGDHEFDNYSDAKAFARSHKRPGSLFKKSKYSTVLVKKY